MNVTNGNSDLEKFYDFVSGPVDDAVRVCLEDDDVAQETNCASWHNRTWHSGRADVKASIDRNNAVRQKFLDALIEAYGEGEKSRGFWCLPEYIRKALKGTWACGQAGDFKLVADDNAAHGFKVTSGRPLSARRIKAVFQAIAREEARQKQTNSVAGVKNKNSVEEVNNVGGKEESEKFKTTFTGFFNSYNFGEPLVGKEMSKEDTSFMVSGSKTTIFKIFSATVFYRVLDDMLKNVKDDITDSSRKSEKLYGKLKTGFCTTLRKMGMLNARYERDDSKFEKAGAKVFYDFIVAFNEKNPDFAITIPQEEIDAHSQQQNEQPQQV